jgi:hypothetical protein
MLLKLLRFFAPRFRSVSLRPCNQGSKPSVIVLSKGKPKIGFSVKGGYYLINKGGPKISMSNIFEPHLLASLFPELPPEELAELARDIKERGQLEPIILHKGLILDGRNRYRACQMAGVKPQTEEFNPKATKRSPSEFVLSRNLRRRHLSVGQKAAIALEWSEQIQLGPNPEKNRRRGRPKAALTEAAKNIGMNEQRVFEVRQIRDANPALYREVRAGSRNLNSGLAEISTAQGRLIVQPVRQARRSQASKERDVVSNR